MLGTSTIEGRLEIDHNRGVIYFHADPGEMGAATVTTLRICSLPIPIPLEFLDITHMNGCNWKEGRNHL